MTKTAVIAGVGPGFCEALARQLAEAGYAIGLFARSEAYLSELADTLRDEGSDALAVPTDVTDPDAVEAGFDRVRDVFGPVGALAYTASTTTESDAAPLDPTRFERLWRVYAYGGLLCFRAALPDLRERNGTALFFGSAPSAGDVAYHGGKDAMRGMADRLAERYAPDGVHVAHVVIADPLLNPDVFEEQESIDETAYLDPDAAAATCTHLINQSPGARTFELDLRAGGDRGE